jgi:hypothetical protein
VASILQNLGRNDRILRVCAGSGLFALGVLTRVHALLSVVSGLLGLALVISGAAGS